ncbi:acyl-CoA ligase (AMP-forming), exosortase A system-associated [Aliikangiella marina]|uniref:Acyl-CoA ligase (AMP-forming), exosortase A system-associated n=1 Tax=Aliikangiella marina TaxID=1712262 RepID=A0A545T991_9GAMM|nr:acyl-CoA ligase (AMP-forming), exosortase A system-associated [Aliikangiella marina]TQV73768.1 acyl-CoA ligase (AMP-forming), exosortase A system-associated [Aliikangiella marina]
MPQPQHQSLFHHTLTRSPNAGSQALAITHKSNSKSYQDLQNEIEDFADGLNRLGINKSERVAIYLPKQLESVIAFYGTSIAGGVFVPINPLLKGPQVNYILDDCQVSYLVTSKSRFKQISAHLESITSLKAIILTDGELSHDDKHSRHPHTHYADLFNGQTIGSHLDAQKPQPPIISQDVAAILYTSGSTGNPKGVVLSHQNLVAGAKSVTEYLENTPDDRLLAVLPFSFDYGLSQLTTAFLSGASVVLMEYLLPKDVIRAVTTHQITGLAAVPPLWVQLAEIEWPAEAKASLRYITNSGGAMPQATLEKLQQQLPTTSPFLMYGLTEAFRSTFLPPEEVTNRPTSMGKAIPDAEILVINSQGKVCQPGEEGELVHRGPHVALGYWNAPEKTAVRFKPLPREIAEGLIDEIAVWSGDTVVKDEEDFLYFIGRQDDMIKSSGYRISPSELEDCLYNYPNLGEVAALGIPHPSLGQAVVLVIKVIDIDNYDEADLLKFCQKNLPNFMQPKSIIVRESLPRNPNGKINRKILAEELQALFI